MTILAFYFAHALHTCLPVLASGSELAEDATRDLADFNHIVGPGGDGEHAPGPWRPGGGAHVTATGTSQRFLRDQAGHIVACEVACYLTGDVNSRAATTVRRVLAAVNACEGITDAQLAAAATEDGQWLTARMHATLSNIVEARLGTGVASDLLDDVDAIGASALPEEARPTMPWHVGRTAQGGEDPRNVFATFVRRADGKAVILAESDHPRARANARRMAATVNACWGLPLWLLESLPHLRARTARPDTSQAA